MSHHRWWISLAYCLMAVLSQGLHLHGDGRLSAIAVSDDAGGEDYGGCHPTGSHGHLHEAAGPFAEPIDDHCPACQFHFNHHAPLNGSAINAVAPSSAIRSGPESTFADRRLIRVSCRAPPIRS